MTSHAKASTAGSNLRQAKGLGLLFAALAVAALVVLSSSVFAAEFTEHVRGFGPDGTESSNFEFVGGVAVDQQSGNVYALDPVAGALYKFNARGQALDWGGANPNITANRLGGIVPSGSGSQVAVDSSSNVVYVTEEHSLRAFQANGEPAVFSAGPGTGTNAIGGFIRLVGVAVDANGDIYASEFDPSSFNGTDYNGTVHVYAPSGESLTSFAAPSPANVAVAPDGAVYLTTPFRTSVRKFVPSEFPVTAATTYSEGPKLAEVNGSTGHSLSGVGVDPVSGEIYVIEGAGSNGAWIRKYDSSGAFIGFLVKSGEKGELAQANGIAVVGGGAEFQFYAGSIEAFGASKVEIYGEAINPGPPSIESPWATGIGGDSATLHALINPNTAASTYRFEYGTEDCAIGVCASVPLGGAGIGSGHRLVAVSQLITGLEAGTTYHYRVVAQNSFDPGDPVESPDRTFTTQLSGLGFQLADNRAWEMVSPAKKFAGKIRPVDNFPLQLAQVQAAADGNGLVYSSIGPLDQWPEGNRVVEQSSVNLSRRGAEGWHSKDITPPHTEVTVLGYGSEHKLFTPDLGKSVVEPRDATPLSPQASERTIYLRDNTEPATYTPLVTGKEGFANVPPGTVFSKGWDLFNPPLEMMGANSAFTHVVFVSHQAGLSPGDPPNSLYMWSGGQLQLIDELPAGEGGGIPTPAELGSGLGSVRHAVSEDGSRVFWSAGTYPEGVSALYAHDTEGEETVRLDLAKPGASEAGDAQPAFQGASADGSVVFFTDSQQLTADANTNGRDLYRCVVSFEATPGCASLTDISATSGESARVQDMSPAIGDDGTHVYFVAEGVLDSVPNGNGDSAVAGEPNLYLWREGAGVRFIATRAEGDDSDWVVAAEISASASPNGRYFSFSSERSLTGYDNRDAIGDKPVQEIFRYDALTDRLECVSCNPSGARPDGEKQSSKPFTLADPSGLLAGQWVAAILPQATTKSIPATVVSNSFYRRRGVLDNGRVFFNAIDALVPADSNGQWDVYEYEPTGVGDCTASSASASLVRSAGGCVSLISSGTAEEEAAFIDASVSGDDAFFVTPAQLSVTDEDGELDIYDARVDGVPATLTPNPECLGEACQPPASAPNDPTPASAGFKGKGNLKPSARKRCAKGKRQVRRNGKARCVARKQHKRASKARRASKSGRAGR